MCFAGRKTSIARKLADSGVEFGRVIFLPLSGILLLGFLDDEVGKINKVIMADVVVDLSAGHWLDDFIRVHILDF